MQRATLARLAGEHLTRRVGRGLRPSTIANERSTVMQLARWWDKRRRAPSSLTEADFEEYLFGPDGLRKREWGGEVTDASYNAKLFKLKPFVARLVKMGVFEPGHLELIEEAKREVDGRDYTQLSHSQLQDAVQGAPTPWERWIMAFGTFSLGRQGEMLLTRMHHFNLEYGRIAWRRPKVRDVDGLPILAQLEEEYLLWRDAYLELCPDISGDSFVIPGRRQPGRNDHWGYYPDQPPSQIGSVVKRNVARVLGVSLDSLKNEAAHILRRSGARALYNALRDAGVEDPIRIVQTMLGHTQQATTERYIGIRADRERRDSLLRGSKLLAWSTSNVVELKAVGSGHS